MNSTLVITDGATTLRDVKAGGKPGGPFFRAAQAIIILLLGVIYAGCLQFFITISPLMLYGTYVVILACLAVCLFFDWQPARDFLSVLPYLAWLSAYFLWGMIVSADSDVVKEGVKYLIKNILLISALALVVNRSAIRYFIYAVLIGVLANLAVCLWETYDPSLVEKIAQIREQGATAYNVLRPAGLWSNPDEASSAFIFAIILARWAPGMLARLAQCGSMLGIVLTASRTGVYILVICLAVFSWIWIRQRGFSSKLAAGICGIALALVVCLAVAASQPWFRVPEGAQINRIADFSESNRGAHEASRLEIATAAINKAADGPWYGYGLFAFQSEYNIHTELQIPPHNVFLVVWGEAGLLWGMSYVLLLMFGIWRTLRAPLPSGDQIALLLMWFCYLLIGLTWHNQFTAFSGMLYIALLWHLPQALVNYRDEGSAAL